MCDNISRGREGVNLPRKSLGDKKRRQGALHVTAHLDQQQQQLPLLLQQAKIARMMAVLGGFVLNSNDNILHCDSPFFLTSPAALFQFFSYYPATGIGPLLPECYGATDNLARLCASGCVVECRICNWEVAGSNLGLGYFAPSFYSAFHPSGVGK